MAGIFQTLLGSLAGVAKDTFFKYVTLLLPGNGSNGAQNNTFLDASTNNFTITRNGNTTQGTFTPFGDNWSNYFSGVSNNTGLSLPSNAAFQFGTGDFCIEALVFPTSATNLTVLATCDDITFSNGLSFFIDASGNPAVFSFVSNVTLLTGSGATAPLNTWSHVAISRSGTTLRVFVNGAQVGSTTNSENFQGNSAGGGIGAYVVNPAAPFIGYLSNVRVVKGSAVYTGTYTVPTAPLTAITNTVLLTCQSNRFVDNSINAFVIGNINTTNVVTVQRFSPFNPTDAYSTSVIGGSGYFDGTGDYLSTSGTSSFNPSTGSWTFEAWCYFTSSSNTDYLITGLTSGTASFYIAWVGTTFYVGDGVTNNINGIASSKPVNQWFHVAVVKNGSTYTAYINGSSIASSTTALASSGVTTFEIGARSPASLFSIGYISNFRYSQSAVYTAAFTPPASPVTGGALLLNFANGGIIDNAMMNDLETVGNAQISTAQSKFGGSSIAFDGTGDYLIGPGNARYIFGTGDFTVECWLYLNAINRVNGIWTNGTAAAGSFGFYVTSGNKLEAAYFGGATVTGATSLATGQWYHVAVSRSGTTTRVYLNGTQDATNTSSNNNTTGDCVVGNSFTNQTDSPNGYIDDLRITKGVARYTATFTPPGPLPTS